MYNRKTKNSLEINKFSMKNQIELIESINWWEKKRLWFNLIIGILGITCIVTMNNGHFSFSEFLQIILYGLVANIFYTAGIMVEIFNFYYFGGRLNINRLRLFFFMMGTLVTCFTTYIYAFSYYN